MDTSPNGHFAYWTVRILRGQFAHSMWARAAAFDELRCSVSRQQDTRLEQLADDLQPFRSRANSLPGANWPIEPWPIRSVELSFPGLFAPWNLRSLALSLLGPFAPWPSRSLASAAGSCSVYGGFRTSSVAGTSDTFPDFKQLNLMQLIDHYYINRLF